MARTPSKRHTALKSKRAVKPAEDAQAETKPRHWREKEARAAGLLTEEQVMAAVRKADGHRLTYEAIAATVGKPKEAAYYPVDKLARKGWLKQALNSSKRRCFSLTRAAKVISDGTETGVAS